MIDNLPISLFLLFSSLFLFCRLYLTKRESFFVAITKVIIVGVYFLFVDYKWTHSDDIKYINMSRIMYEEVGLLHLLTFDGFQYVFSKIFSYHYLYYVYNAAIQFLLGFYYYSPVLGNVFVSSVSGLFLYKICLEFDYNKVKSRRVALFFILHVDVITWSSFINIKDGFVILFCLIAFLSLIRFRKGLGNGYLLVFLLSLLPLIFIRFYAPVLMFFSVILFFLIESYRIRYWHVLLCMLFFTVFYLNLSSLIRLELIEPNGFISGLVRFPLTPLTWNIESEYSYLMLSSFFNIVLYPALIIGMYYLWVNYKMARLLVIYFLVVVSFYALVPELQGPRQRYQLIPIIALAQFEGVIFILKKINRYFFRTKKSPSLN